MLCFVKSLYSYTILVNEWYTSVICECAYLIFMSGHSKWSTIKRKKEATDKVRGKLFSQLSKAISVAIKTGGGNNPETNYKLKIAIDAAKSANMPKQNIDRILSKSESGSLTEVVYEGFSPGGAGILVEVATDNTNRSAQEVKHMLEKGGGQFVSPGAVSYNFSPMGFMVINKHDDDESQMLDLIDLGVEEIDEEGDVLQVYVEPSDLHALKEKIESKGYTVESAQLIQKPKTEHTLTGSDAKRTVVLLETLEDHEDVQNVFTNADIEI